MSRCQVTWKRHAWALISTPESKAAMDAYIANDFVGAAPKPKYRCLRCGTDRNLDAGGPLHKSEFKRPRFKTDPAAQRGFSRRTA